MNSELFNNTPAEYNVFKDFILRRDWIICWSIFCTQGLNFGKGYGGVLGVYSMESTFVADLCRGDEADLAANVRFAPAHGTATTAAAAPGSSQGGRSHDAVTVQHARSLALSQHLPPLRQTQHGDNAASATLPQPTVLKLRSCSAGHAGSSYCI